MPPESASKQMRAVTELTVVADIKPGLVEIRETISYATRAAVLLRTLYELRRASIEELQSVVPMGALERLGFLHFVRFGIIDNRRLLLTTTFDGAWEPYIRAIANQAGPILDVIFCNCVGYEDHASDMGYERFAEWVRKHQVTSQFFFADAPGTTVKDVRLLQQQDDARRGTNGHEGAKRRRKHETIELHERLQEDSVTLPDTQAGAALLALHSLREFYPDPPIGSLRRDHLFLHRTAHLLLHGQEFGALPTDIPTVGADEWEKAKQWFARREAPEPERERRAHRFTPRSSDIQHGILDRYGDTTHGCLVLCRVHSLRAARDFLRDQIETLRKRDPFTMNIAFTLNGLRSLGLQEHELAQLPAEFREGMEARAGWLGDRGPNHPRHWKLPRANWPLEGPADRPPVRLSTVDFVIQLQLGAPIEQGDHLWSASHPLYPHVEELARRAAPGVQFLAVEPMLRKPAANGPVEHFGFLDGISQPTTQQAGPERDRIPLGDLLIGYPDSQGDSPQAPLDILDQGSFLALRKLHQDVGQFRAVLESEGRKISKRDGAEKLAARMMGRTYEGAPLTSCPSKPAENDFTYTNDRDGSACPLQAHVRLANPREGAPARLLRRGFSYGARFEDLPEDPNRGLFFMAYNASLADQFEQIQRWLTGANITGLSSRDNDPILGLPEPGKRRTLRLLDEHGQPQLIDLQDKPFVTLEWGAYLFVPSLPGLERLTNHCVSPAERGDDLIEQLEKLRQVEGDEEAQMAWKKLLEDPGARPKAAEVWAAIRARGGVLETPYGFLVGSQEAVMNIFRDEATFSVRGYWERQRDSLGEHYLGMDPKAIPIQSVEDPAALELDREFCAKVGDYRYWAESTAANAWIGDVQQGPAFDRARACTFAALALIAGSSREPVRVKLTSFVRNVIAAVSQQWFELPDGELMKLGGIYGEAGEEEPARCPHDFGATARYVFSPNPTDFVEREGQQRGQRLRQAALDYVRRTESPRNGTLLAHLRSEHNSDDVIARVLVGAVHGFVGPTGGSLFSVLDQWLENEDLWRHQQALLARSYEDAPTSAFVRAKAVLGDAVVRTMQRNPFPYVLHRMPVRNTTICNVEVPAGARVVLGLVSAAQEQPGKTEVLFGGIYGTNRAPVHACPGHEMALGTILGILSALLESAILEPQPGRQFTLELRQSAAAALRATQQSSKAASSEERS